MEDALLSAESFAILSGAGLIAASVDKPIYVHTTAQVEAIADNTLIVDDLVCWNGGRTSTGATAIPSDYYHKEADIFCMKLDGNGEIAVEPCVPAAVAHQADGSSIITCHSGDKVVKGDIVLIDYYVKRTSKTQMIEITADKFGGNYYLEASTLFRREADGVDMPAEFVIPNCKIQSNFTFAMASSGDPSTFTFTIDAFPDYTKFDRTHKVLAAIQVIEDEENADDEEYREPCSATVVDFDINNKYESYNGSGAEFSVIDANTIKVTGNVVNQTYDTSVFGPKLNGANGTQVTIKFSGLAAGIGNYTIVQTNPALSAYYSTDSSVKGKVKTKSYDGDDLNTEGYDFLVSDQRGDIKIELKDQNGHVIETHNFKNEVEFI